MLVIRNIRVWTLSRNSLTVSWEIEPTVLDSSDYTLSVLRSESEAGPFSVVGSAFAAGSTDEYVDSTVNLFSKIRRYVYRLRVTRSSDGETLDFGSTSPRQVVQGDDPGGVYLRSPPDVLALEAIRRFDLQLQRFSGRQVLLFTQKTFGTYCTTCYDKLKRRRTRSNCSDCYDTGYDGGYYSPKQTYAGKAPDKVVTQIGPIMELQPSDRLWVMPARPRVKPRDFLVDAEGIRYRVLHLPSIGEKLWSLTHQRVVVRELSRDQVEYAYPLTQEDWDVDPFKGNPVKQHIAATDIDSYNKRARDLGVMDA
jgi:hypothetical protein